MIIFKSNFTKLLIIRPTKVKFKVKPLIIAIAIVIEEEVVIIDFLKY